MRVDPQRSLVESAVDLSVPEPFGVYCFLGTEPAAELARSVEGAVFLDAFGNTPELLAAEYGRYEAVSAFLVVIDHLRQLPAGVMRMVLPVPGGPGLKSLNDLATSWAEPADVMLGRIGVELPAVGAIDIATLAISPAYRTPAALGIVTVGLYQSLAVLSGRVGLDWLVAILDVAVLRLLRHQLRSAFVAFGDARPYLGSPASQPACCQLSAWRPRLAEAAPDLERLFFLAKGVEAAMRTLDFDDAAQRVLGLLGPLYAGEPIGSPASMAERSTESSEVHPGAVHSAPSRRS